MSALTTVESTNSSLHEVLARAEGIWKDFGGADVLKGASIELRAGEVHGIVGENGAGKSTLAKIIGGVHRPRRGGLSVRGRTFSLHNPRSAIGHGIALIHQEPMTFPDLTVAENIFIGRQPRRRGSGAVNWRAMLNRSHELLERLGIAIDPRSPVRGLSVADQQMIEMAAALSQDARIFLLDETTASLTPTEVKDLFRVVRQLRDSGAALAFIGHRMEEIFEICDRITVLRDGEVVARLVTRHTSIGEVLRLMVGRPMEAMFQKQVAHEIGPPMLEVLGLTRRGEFEHVSFNVRAGEIVGLAGLVGAGRTELARAIFGITRADSGELRVGGHAVFVRGPRDAMRHGLAMVPEDRQHHGLLMPVSIWQNATLAAAPQRLSRLGFFRDAAARRLARDYAQRLRVKCRDVRQSVRELSGGNQQKVVLGKWLMTEPRVIILDEPTRGIDVGAKAEVHRLVSDLAAAGTAVLMISSELPEVMAMSDRVLVMREGRIVAELDRTQATPESVIAAATGQATPHDAAA